MQIIIKFSEVAALNSLGQKLDKEFKKEWLTNKEDYLEQQLQELKKTKRIKVDYLKQVVIYETDEEFFSDYAEVILKHWDILVPMAKSLFTLAEGFSKLAKVFMDDLNKVFNKNL